MIYFIKIIFLILISQFSFANEDGINKILFKINNKVFTNIDLEKRKEYLATINNTTPSEFTESDNKQILDDYISALIYYEFYNKNRISIKNINDEINLFVNKNFEDNKKLNQIKINNFKFNAKIDLIRNKIIEKELNSKKSKLLQESNNFDLIYNYNLQYIIIKENKIDEELFENIDDRNKFDNLKKFLIKKNINFFYKEKEINDKTTLSSRIKNIINQNIKTFKYKENGYINLISINKNLVSYEGIFVKLINFKTSKAIDKKNLKCENLNKTININKTVFKKYEYSKLNNNIKNNLKAVNDFIVFNDNQELNYIVLCDLTYDENLLKNINFNKKINISVMNIQKNFLKKYKNEYNFIQNK
tara:strand:+ start:2295 stop:3377 length:1083 start_codon:yes stop_codon:yes gene_type:complete